MTHSGPRTGTTLDSVAEAGRKAALIGYLPVGFPSVEGSIEAMVELVRNGVDIVEVGVPYSDPGMDGPVIQRAAEAALEAGVRTKDVFRAVEAIADAGGTAVVMSYWNLVLQYGVRDFARDLDAAGGGGIITPDLIPDEAGDWLAASDEYDLDRIFLAAPSSTPERLATIVSGTRGFVYAASTMGVTGVRSEVDSHARDLVARLKEAGAERACVGLGVSSREQAAEVAEYADGVIVGSALVRALDADGVPGLGRLAAELAEGCA
ncbi:tryptophan synthase subunit alpha [Brevibacterium spongiae]|uniref:Tryptophan synthase alpha chain n=1 Tax=Brevibacterium spongiae TaxID=2909672 RepID=A0ABY5SN31_9MICO|nr:tryptophan synthase subunit alpha [Brevibacterium spongiae]UVI34479.1 tryptophan synthase subunit alpha [Brevibacterium spongiae]